ncbi:hypothetical protein BCR34DRAFT_565162 [Clohesyomyces aquaticus]|uniref:Uncharacterized protein n=1 Tax=Clohesyomyces aquaticus TaxID=1231657 RepID=A0A1Y1ZMU5_9PLEO|nr:hypothetical protein BCR34DRAFT_565162 [Clohesyomyces aquaticus]
MPLTKGKGSILIKPFTELLSDGLSIVQSDLERRYDKRMADLEAHQTALEAKNKSVEAQYKARQNDLENLVKSMEAVTTGYGMINRLAGGQ